MLLGSGIIVGLKLRSGSQFITQIFIVDGRILAFSRIYKYKCPGLVNTGLYAGIPEQTEEMTIT